MVVPLIDLAAGHAGVHALALLFMVCLQLEQQADALGELVVLGAPGAVMLFVRIEKLAAIAVLACFENEKIAAALAPENGRAGGEHGCVRIESQIAVGKFDGDNAAIALLQRRFDHPALGGVEIGDRSGGVAHSILNANLK